MLLGSPSLYTIWFLLKLLCSKEYCSFPREVLVQGMKKGSAWRKSMTLLRVFCSILDNTF